MFLCVCVMGVRILESPSGARITRTYQACCAVRLLQLALVVVVCGGSPSLALSDQFRSRALFRFFLAGAVHSTYPALADRGAARAVGALL